MAVGTSEAIRVIIVSAFVHTPVYDRCVMSHIYVHVHLCIYVCACLMRWFEYPLGSLSFNNHLIIFNETFIFYFIINRYYAEIYFY